MKRRWALALGALGAFAIGACDDDDVNITAPRGSEAFDRYVAIGTSLSAGTMSDGILYSTQARSWPALLADQAFADFTYPAIQAPGCPSPLIAPLQLSRRLSGLSATAANTACAPLRDGVTLPTNNLAVPGATTQAALAATPENVPAGLAASLYSRILPSGESQVTAMQDMDPTLVSVELGSNEVLGAVASGQVIPNVTYTPVATWQPVYDQIIDAVVGTGARALLVTVPRVSRIPSMRTGNDLWAARTQFTPFNVVVNANCNGSTNLVFTARLVLTKIAEGQALAAMGQQAQLSCANGAVGPTPDYILTPDDVTAIEAVVDAMNAHITSVAEENGFALVDANAVLQRFIDERQPFTVARVMTCVYPYGQYMSLDGVHPNGEGYQHVANAAAEALNATYGFAIPSVPVLRRVPPCP